MGSLTDQSEDINIWTTRDNRVLPIAEMSDKHIINTIRLLERSCKEAEVPQFPKLDYYEQKFSQYKLRVIFPMQYETLLEEVQKRQLKL